MSGILSNNLRGKAQSPKAARRASVHPFLSQQNYKVNKVDNTMLFNMQQRSKQVASKMKSAVGRSIKELYEQKLKEARARFALMEAQEKGDTIPEEDSSRGSSYHHHQVNQAIDDDSSSLGGDNSALRFQELPDRFGTVAENPKSESSSRSSSPSPRSIKTDSSHASSSIEAPPKQ